MVNIVLVQFLIICMGLVAHAKLDRIFSQSYVGEKRLDSYSERYYPVVTEDIYLGKMAFKDDVEKQNFFNPFLFAPEQEFTQFFNSELNAGLSCPNEVLSEHFDDIRYAYRLITLSYLLEGNWHLQLLSNQFQLKKGCQFDLKSWLNSCRPGSQPMKVLIERLKTYSPRYNESFPAGYSKTQWMSEFNKNDLKWYSHYRLKQACSGPCSDAQIEDKLRATCAEDQKIMTLICSEMDEIYGLSTHREAYTLLGQSHIINTFNKSGEALGCLRRFSQMMSSKEVHYRELDTLFPSLQNFLRGRYQERFLQGRAFFYGASKEFEDKGLKDLFVKEQPFKVEVTDVEEKLPLAPEKAAPLAKIAIKKPEVQASKLPEKKEVVEIKSVPKSAFLVAAEMRASAGLQRVEVDMLKLKYDYVFSLHQMNTLADRLKIFMTREALGEMMTYDKLGTKEGPVPLLFLKFMIDMQEHQGMYNLVSILGDKFYVSNEIDSTYKTTPELIQLVNNELTGRQWQIFILKP